jgi:hypothetical protein
MKLVVMQNEVKRLNALAKKEFKGKTFSIPTSLLEEDDSISMSVCKVINVDLQEDSVEIIYEVNGEKDNWTSLKTSTFEQNAIAISLLTKEEKD